ncbi:MAG: ADP-glyceromanno-heptose 6-epimerase [Flammeovirgaceae bacterium]|nr:ADP-glyceromanno-heptose 6-epimerase [Flammeovirgaceae bacterium]MBE63900.1 ADP-glyceromanno-heptose 6-epimerase [Flammeovirgaceae bacterium]MBR09689.1 ADP-glyceromanno-heptose 6-epimerase [Rickettsiales bacterium]|tara:strand:+ start:3469 stop:4368 length:900 start_codon:yes stop_codon:yes gene_type:complete
MIVITGAAGFIGCNLIRKLNELNYNHLIVVDKFDNELKNSNLEGTKLLASIDRDVFIPWARENTEAIEFIFHLGARTDTTEMDLELLRKLNTEYSKSIWKLCVDEQIPLIYASSAATYGSGELGFSDDESLIPQLKPLNPYAVSKQEFDLWALAEEKKPFFWAGLKFFNVYGPYEQHKGKMASMIHQCYLQIQETGKVKLFKSYRDSIAHGEQKRDFVHVSDVVNILIKLMHHRKQSGIYNLGTGKAKSFNEMVNQVFISLNLEAEIEYIDMPEEIRDKYQYFTQAEMGKLIKELNIEQ